MTLAATGNPAIPPWAWMALLAASALQAWIVAA
jgi:hypothetical protein